MSFSVDPMAPRTLSWWRDERDDFDFDPVYQRKGKIWSERDKQYLIDSFFNGFDVPKIYVADFTILNSPLNALRKKYAVIDGKQRLRAVLDFFDGEFALARDFEYLEDPSLPLAGLAYQDLVLNYPRIARRFDNASFTVMKVITDDESKINELFVRLNTSKPLTGAELRNAMTGKVPEIIRELVAHVFFTDRVRFTTNRSQDKNTAAKLLLIEHRGALIDTKKAQLDALVVEANDEADDAPDAFEETAAEQTIMDTVEETENPDIERSKERVMLNLDRMASVFITKDTVLAQQAQIVVLYWLIRETDKALLPRMRPFLINFEEARKTNKTAQIRDAELDEFELMARTSNDASSIRRRYQILRRRFDEFIV
jgi:hypothetical protein